jgi:hypothetical protein
MGPRHADSHAGILPRACHPGGWPLPADRRAVQDADGARLLTEDGADHVTLAQVTVRNRSHEMAAPQPQFTWMCSSVTSRG